MDENPFRIASGSALEVGALYRFKGFERSFYCYIGPCREHFRFLATRPEYDAFEVRLLERESGGFKTEAGAPIEVEEV